MADPTPGQEQERFDGDQREREEERVVLHELLEHYPAHLSVTELVTILEDEVAVEDGINRLAHAGLVHRRDDFVFATRAAKRAGEIAG